VAPDQPTAQRYVDVLRGWLPGTGRAAVRLATSDIADAHEAIAAYRLRSEPAVLVTVAMAYEGMDCPEVTHVACLTHIRSRPWLEQMIARATRVDPHGGAYDEQRAVIYHPDDQLFADFRHAIETEQGTRAQAPKRSSRQGELALGPQEDGRGVGLGITPLRSNATALRFDTVAAGPDFAGCARKETGSIHDQRGARRRHCRRSEVPVGLSARQYSPLHPRHAVQAPCRAPPSVPARQVPRHELVRVRGGIAPARQPDGLFQR
jgi:hypothetical protein